MKNSILFGAFAILFAIFYAFKGNTASMPHARPLPVMGYGGPSSVTCFGIYDMDQKLVGGSCVKN